jgi:NADPH:quinone reductase-like Zn-dependent oxidoreductase
MKAVLLKGRGGLDQLEYRVDVLVPELKEGEVLVRVGAAAQTRVGPASLRSSLAFRAPTPVAASSLWGKVSTKRG